MENHYGSDRVGFDRRPIDPAVAAAYSILYDDAADVDLVDDLGDFSGGDETTRPGCGREPAPAPRCHGRYGSRAAGAPEPTHVHPPFPSFSRLCFDSQRSFPLVSNLGTYVGGGVGSPSRP